MGSRTIARPSATRWRWPPESACGLRSSSSARPSVPATSRHAALDLRARIDVAPPQAEREIVVHAHVRIERVGLEHHGDVAILGRHVIDDAAVDRAALPEVIDSRPAIIRSVVDLPQPDGPSSTMNSPCSRDSSSRERVS